MPSSNQLPEAHGSASFLTTHWTVVLAAKDRSAPQAREALAALCSTYWYPVYVFIRRQGYAAEPAQDLTQDFFVSLLERDFLENVDQSKGKFRSFLLACCKHFLANERDRERALKRGGGKLPLPLDFVLAESRYAREASVAITPEKLFERRWALTLLDRVLLLLRDEFTVAGKDAYFEALKLYLAGDNGGRSYVDFGAEFGMSEGAVKVAVHRLRRRYRALLRGEIARTVGTPEEVEAEIRDLFAILGA